MLGEQLWDTESVRPRERLAYWREGVNATMAPVSIVCGAREDFAGSLRSRRVGPMRIVRARSARQRFTRTSSLIAANRSGELFLNLALRGSRTVRQCGREARMRAGDMLLLDTARPYEQHFHESFEHLTFAFPAELIERRIAVPAAATAIPIPGDSGLGAILASELVELAEQAPRLDAAVCGELAAHSVDLIALALGRAPDRPTAVPSRQLLLQAALDAIEARLADPELRPALVAEHLNVSVRLLHRLFEGHGITFGRQVLRQRLERCSRELADPTRAHLSIAAICTAWGFREPSHFSRAFRAHFGELPRDYRRRCLGGEGGR